MVDGLGWCCADATCRNPVLEPRLRSRLCLDLPTHTCMPAEGPLHVSARGRSLGFCFLITAVRNDANLVWQRRRLAVSAGSYSMQPSPLARREPSSSLDLPVSVHAEHQTTCDTAGAAGNSCMNTVKGVCFFILFFVRSHPPRGVFLCCY